MKDFFGSFFDIVNPMIALQMLKAKTTNQNFTDNLMYLVAFAYPLTTIPQIITIFSNHSSTNISLASWSLYAACSVITLLYAISHKLKPLIIEGVLWTMMYSGVIAGILIYR